MVNKRICGIMLTLLLTSILELAYNIQANPAMNLTVETDKQEYYNKDLVQVYGNLTLDGVPITDGLVGLQIQNSGDKLLTIRTLSTGAPPLETPYVFVEYVTLSDQNGNNKSSVLKGTLAYFKISIVNQDMKPHNVTITLVTYYNDNTPFGHVAAQAKPLNPGPPAATFLASIPIPTDAVLGTATVYASAYTDYPKLGGTPYCIEKNATFQITDGTLGEESQKMQNSLKTLQTDETANYNLEFRLPQNAPYDDYTTYVTSRYSGQSISNSTTFTVYEEVPNQPPYEPTATSQYRSDGVTVIPEGGTTPESTVVFKATVSDPDGDSVRLEIELRQISEAFAGEPTPETISDYVSSGTQVTITRYGLVNADYKWRYRAKDIDGATNDWTGFGASGNIDFTVSVPTIADSFRLPLDGLWTKGRRFDVYYKDEKFDGYHLGVDMLKDFAAPVYAPANGVVKFSDIKSDFGYVVVIEHRLMDGAWVCSVLGHLGKDGRVPVGSFVVRGQIVGYLSTVAAENEGVIHLHFGIRRGQYDPGLASDGKWYYRGYATLPLAYMVDDWHPPLTFIDYYNVHKKAPVAEMKIRLKCPVDMTVTDPGGSVINKTSDEIPGMFYTELDLNGTGDFTDTVTFWERKMGNYIIDVAPEPNATITDRYTLEVSKGNITAVLAENVSISNIPSYPYIVTSNETTIIPRLDPHDIGIARFATSKTVVGQNFPLHVNMTIFNYGLFTEAFNITVYSNTTIIATFTNVTLTSRNSTTITFTWNTTGFAKGNYTISAVADQVPGELYIADNAFTDDWILITKVGDLGSGPPPRFFEFDGKVDGNDLALFVKCYKGTAPPEYRLLGDLGSGPPPKFFQVDGKVDGNDLALFIRCYKGLGPDT